MAVLTDVEPMTEQKAVEGRLSWPIFLLTLAAVTSSSLSVLSLHQLMALRAEVEGLKSEVCRRREEGGRESKHASQTEHIRSRRSSQEPQNQTGSKHTFTLTRRRRSASGVEPNVSQPCLQLLASNSRKTFSKEFTSEPHTGIPWRTGLRRGAALEADGDSMIVREEGFYFVYSQVFYMDSYLGQAMGHVVIRRKRNVVGDEPQYVVLFRCIQNMNEDDPFNTCYTGGIAKLEVGDHLELLIPRPTANVSMDGEDTFLGAVKLA
uniref:tumor necrosis factor ligand superfamily member 13B n=1 Tax=Semicossyphus pulcher TaxID=241346 RepID=UPI0037E71690